MTTTELFDDPLFDFELKVARRADELSRSDAQSKSPFELWTAAEQEVLEAPPLATAMIGERHRIAGRRRRPRRQAAPPPTAESCDLVPKGGLEPPCG